MIVSFLLIFIIIGAVFLLKLTNISSRFEIGKLSDISSKTSSIFLPNFNKKSKVVWREDEKWIAANNVIRIQNNEIRFFTQQDGLPGIGSFDIINHNNQIWVGQHGGAAKYNVQKNTFEVHLKGQSNISFFEDPYTKTLYASTFRGFFIYDDNTNVWTASLGPKDTRQMEFTDKYIVSSIQNSYPAIIYDKSKDEWEKANIPEFGDQQSLNLFKVGERVFISGRSAEYSSCEDHGKEPSTIFFEFIDGQWQSVRDLNDKFTNFEADVLKNNSQNNQVFFVYDTSECSNRAADIKKVIYDFSSGIKLVEESDYNRGQDDKIDKTVQDISKMIGLSPRRFIQAIDGEGNLYAETSTVNDNSQTSLSFSVIQAQKNDFKELSIFNTQELKDFNRTEPIICDVDKFYLIASLVNEMSGETEKTKLYKIEDHQPQEITNIKEQDLKNIPEGSAICREKFLYWIKVDWQSSKTSFNKMNLENYELQRIGSDLDKVMPNYLETYQDKIYFIEPNQKRLYVFNTSQEQLTDFNISNYSSDKLELIYADEGFLWLHNNESKQTIITDLTGNKISELSFGEGSPSIVRLDNDHYLISNLDGVFVYSIDQKLTKALDRNKLLFWGNESLFMPDTLKFDMFYDAKNKRVWFESGYNLIGAFVLDEELLLQ